jgi:hypothetical protein
MSDLSLSARVKRGFQRVGIVLALALAVPTFGLGIMFSAEEANRYGPLPPGVSAGRLTPEQIDRLRLQGKLTPEQIDRLQKLPPDPPGYWEYKFSEAHYRDVLMVGIGKSALAATAVGMVAYLFITAISWIVRGFMREY